MVVRKLQLVRGSSYEIVEVAVIFIKDNVGAFLTGAS